MLLVINPFSDSCLCINVFDQAEERKAAVRKIPEQMILSEVRRMVEEMQALNKKLEDTVSSQSS